MRVEIKNAVFERENRPRNGNTSQIFKRKVANTNAKYLRRNKRKAYIDLSGKSRLVIIEGDSRKQDLALAKLREEMSETFQNIVQCRQ